MFGASLPEKSIVNIKVIEKTGRRNLPILQEEETFRIFGKCYSQNCSARIYILMRLYQV